MHGPASLSIWFFIGILLTIYGVLITATGIYELVSPPPSPPAMASLHANLWWGLILLAFGLVYFVRFFPARRR